MVQVVLKLVVHLRHSEQMVRTLRSLMLPLRAAPGFVSCGVYLEADRPEAICYTEEWRTPDDLNQRILSNHYTRLLAVMEEAVEPPDLHFNWVTDVKGLEYLEAVRLGIR
jgi:quinol monooxygenase YgiN